MFPMALQVPACVGDAIRHHLLFNNAQLGAGHELSNRSTAVVEKAHDVMKASTSIFSMASRLYMLRSPYV